MRVAARQACLSLPSHLDDRDRHISSEAHFEAVARIVEETVSTGEKETTVLTSIV